MVSYIFFKVIIINKLTLYSKLEISLLIDFWDLIISDDNRLNIFFFSIALLIFNRKVSLFSIYPIYADYHRDRHIPFAIGDVSDNG